jgi:hypothetical protein
MDFGNQQREHAPKNIDWAGVERLKSFKFLAVTHITDNLKWSMHRQCGEEGLTVPLQPQDSDEIWLGPPSHRLFIPLSIS